MGECRHPRLPRHHDADRGDVRRLHLQLHRTHHGHPSGWRPLRIQLPCLRADGRVHRRLRDADRVRLRPSGHRPCHRGLPQRPVPEPRPEARRARRLSRVHAAQHRRRADRGDVRIARHHPGRGRTPRLHGRRGAGLQLVELCRQWLGRRIQLRPPRHRRDVRGDSLRDLVLPRHRGRRHGGRGGEGPQAHDSHRLHHRCPHADGPCLRRDDLRGRRRRLENAEQPQRSPAPGR